MTEIIARAFEFQGYGTLGVLGSVAGDRGRAYNYVYGSAKSMIEKYTEGLQQRLARTKVKVCLIKPGPTSSPLTSNHSARTASADLVAATIVKGMAIGRPKIYAPKRWKYIMMIVRNIPFVIFRRLSF
jgi:short-subunit dehydrogenase